MSRRRAGMALEAGAKPRVVGVDVVSGARRHVRRSISPGYPCRRSLVRRAVRANVGAVVRRTGVTPLLDEAWPPPTSTLVHTTVAEVHLPNASVSLTIARVQGLPERDARHSALSRSAMPESVIRRWTCRSWRTLANVCRSSGLSGCSPNR